MWWSMMTEYFFFCDWDLQVADKRESEWFFCFFFNSRSLFFCLLAYISSLQLLFSRDQYTILVDGSEGWEAGGVGGGFSLGEREARGVCIIEGGFVGEVWER